MPYQIYSNIEGIQEAQARNLKRIAALSPAGKAGEAVRDAIVALHRYVVSITHVGRYDRMGVSGKAIGGSLRASHRMEITGLTGMIYIDPNSVNPLGKKPSVYGVYEHERGGEHAFYDRTVNEYGPSVSEKVIADIKDGLLYA